MKFQKLKIQIKHNKVKNSSSPEATQSIIYKRSRGVELKTAEEKTTNGGHSGAWARDLQISSPAP